jgi:hypothetical protein
LIQLNTGVSGPPLAAIWSWQAKSTGFAAADEVAGEQQVFCGGGFGEADEAFDPGERVADADLGGGDAENRGVCCDANVDR